MRTFLTMLGIIIGISSVIAIVAIGNGFQKSIETEFESFGAGQLTVSLQSSTDITEKDVLTMDDYDLLSQMDNIKYVSPNVTTNAQIKLLDKTETNTATVTGVVPDYYDINSQTLLYGRYISENDVDMETNVCVINDTTALKVFGYANESVLGEKVSIKTWKGTKKYTVVGILENPNAETEMEYQDEYPDTVYMPVSTVMTLASTDMLSSITVVPNNVSDSDMISDFIVMTLENAHDNEDKYYVMDTNDIVDSINSILSYVTIFISFVAAISLLVGGIGVMNIMMVTVTERTREIGIRKAIGAKNSDIRFQFVVEALILTLTGGILGLIIGWILSFGIGMIVGITPVMSAGAICGAVGVSVAIGIIFGVAPANKAALLNPIEALRYE